MTTKTKTGTRQTMHPKEVAAYIANNNRPQTTNDIAHHEMRIKWLLGDNPRWVNGEKVNKNDIHQMLTKSRFVINNPLDGYNSCHCSPACGA